MWSDAYTKVVPRDFKTTIGEFQPQFAGYDQQDSQELMGFLLDGLHVSVCECMLYGCGECVCVCVCVCLVMCVFVYVCVVCECFCVCVCVIVVWRCVFLCVVKLSQFLS